MHHHPLTLKAANAFIRAHHRHHPHARGCIFCLGISDESQLRGVIVIGRPNAAALQDGTTASVTRSCTDGTPNANSQLYAAARRVCQAMGYRRVITYTRDDEPGTSLIAAGWTHDANSPARSWNRPARPRRDATEPRARRRWTTIS